MKTFSRFITETYKYNSREDIVAAIAHYNKVGEILNPEYGALTDSVKRLYAKEGRASQEHILAASHAANRDSELNDLYYGWPSYSASSISAKFIKSLTALEKRKFDDPVVQAKVNVVIKSGQQLITDWKPIVDDLKKLKEKVVKVTQKRAEAKTAAAAVMQTKFTNSASLIKIFDSHLEEYKKMAHDRAKEAIDNRLARLKEADWDLNKVAPYPRSTDSDYKSKVALHNLYNSITKSKSGGTPRRGEPDTRVPNQVAIDRWIGSNVKAAEDSYKNFMQKMIMKIGKPVVKAEMKGNIWTNAILTVETIDGETQVWHTQMILNFSSLGLMFNQFPSRRKK